MNFKLLFSLLLLVGVWSCENSTVSETKSDDKKTEAQDHDHAAGDHAGHGHDHGDAPKKMRWIPRPFYSLEKRILLT